MIKDSFNYYYFKIIKKNYWGNFLTVVYLQCLYVKQTLHVSIWKHVFRNEQSPRDSRKIMGTQLHVHAPLHYHLADTCILLFSILKTSIGMYWIHYLHDLQLNRLFNSFFLIEKVWNWQTSTINYKPSIIFTRLTSNLWSQLFIIMKLFFNG